MVLNNWGTEMVIKIHLFSFFPFSARFSLSLSLWTCFRCLVNFLWQLAEKTLISSLLFILLLFIITRYSYVPLYYLHYSLFLSLLVLLFISLLPHIYFYFIFILYYFSSLSLLPSPVIIPGTFLTILYLHPCFSHNSHKILPPPPFIIFTGYVFSPFLLSLLLTFT